MRLAEVIAKAIYEEPTNDDGLLPKWEKLSRQQQKGWVADADRVMKAIAGAECVSPAVKEEISTEIEREANLRITGFYD